MKFPNLNHFLTKSALTYFIGIVLISITLLGCSDDPAPAFKSPFEVGNSGAMIICEGSYNVDNATITRIDFETGSHSDNYFSDANSGQLLGNTGQDLIIIDTLAIASIARTKTVEVFSVQTGKSIGRLIFPDGVMPRYFAKVSDTLVFVTAYNDANHNSFVFHFNPFDLIASQEKLNTTNLLNLGDGAYPEQIVYDGTSKLFIANSGYGDFGPNTDKASTLAVVDITNLQIISNIKTYVNPTLLEYANGKIYVGNNSYSDAEMCRITEYDATDLKELRYWISYNSKLCMSQSGDTLYYLNGNYDLTDANRGLNIIPLKQQDALPILLIGSNSIDTWYSLAINFSRNEIWIGNGFNYMISGEVKSYNIDNLQAKNTYKTGILPTAIRFY